MTQDPGFVQFVIDQIDESCDMRHRMMFGGCTLYSKGKVVGLICDDRLFIKPTDAGRVFIGEPVMAPAYEGAKDSFLIEDKLEDREWLTELVSVTEQALPKPRPRRKRIK